jgi:hypothetical protein
MATSYNDKAYYTKQIDGSTAVTSTSTRNNRGVIATGSTISNSLFTKVQPANIVSGLAPTNTTPIDGSQTDKALTGGTFAYNGGSGVIVKVTDKLSGVANSFPKSGANKPEQVTSINQKVAGYYASYKTAKLDILSGTFTVAPSAVLEAFTYNSGVTATNSGVTDEAANPSRSIPGEFIYALGTGSGFVYGNYPAKNGG